MVKGIIGGMTDYNHQSFSEIINDLNKEKERTKDFKNRIEENVEILTKNSYWTKVLVDFKNIIAYSLRHYDNAISEFEDIVKDLNIEVKEHHIRRLNKIAKVAQEINVDVGKIWHSKYMIEEYGNDDFYKLESIYRDTRDMAVSLLDTANIAERLNDYVGKTNYNRKKNNPWISGSFYLTIIIVAISGVAVISKMVHWSLLPIIIISGILIVGIVGVLQLKNDDRITDKSFVSLMTEIFKRLPLINKSTKGK
ncbi:MAG: hypothetical protein GXO80_10645 [Chlorobi bacterium]|nr:hypothetical protein [Chlorobiota bacterium]